MATKLEKALAQETIVVVDACLAADAVFGTPARRLVALEFFRCCHTHSLLLIAPPTFAGEIDTALRQSILRSNFPLTQVPGAYAGIDGLPIQLVLDEAELQAVRLRARVLAEMMTQSSVYDATYAALAELRGGTFWTIDKTFANAAAQKRRSPDGKKTVPTLPVVRLLSDFA